MSNTELTSKTTMSVASDYTPKAHKTVWDSAKEPTGFRRWLRIYEAIVSSQGVVGRELIGFLRLASKQEQQQVSNNIAKILQSGAFGNVQAPAAGPGDTASVGSDAVSSERGDLGSHGDSSFARAFTGTQWDDLSPLAKELDAVLYVNLLTVVSGPALIIIERSVGHLKIFTAAICALFENFDVNQASRKMEAITSLQSLAYTKDARVFVIDVMALVQEVHESKVKIQDVILFFIKSAMQGKSRAVVGMIADDMNEYVDKPEGSMNFNIMVTRYALHLSASGIDSDAKVKAVNAIETPAAKQCTNCGKKGHIKETCYQQGGGAYKEGASGCDYCHIKGHKAEECYRKAQGIAPGAPLPKKNPVATVATTTQKVTSATISACLDQMAGSLGSRVNAVLPTTPSGTNAAINDIMDIMDSPQPPAQAAQAQAAPSQAAPQEIADILDSFVKDMSLRDGKSAGMPQQKETSPRHLNPTVNKRTVATTGSVDVLGGRIAGALCTSFHHSSSSAQLVVPSGTSRNTPPVTVRDSFSGTTVGVLTPPQPKETTTVNSDFRVPPRV